MTTKKFIDLKFKTNIQAKKKKKKERKKAQQQKLQVNLKKIKLN